MLTRAITFDFPGWRVPVFPAGVCSIKDRSVFDVRVCLGAGRRFVGRFGDEKAAARAYREAVGQMGELPRRTTSQYRGEEAGKGRKDWGGAE
jgi:hypothetical protein